MLTMANVGSQAFSFLSGLVIARGLGTVGRGQVSLVQAYDDVSTNLFSIGTPESAAYLVKEKATSEARALGAALKISLVSLPIAVFVGWVVARFAFDEFPIGLQIVAWSAIGMTPLANTYLSTCRMLLVARGDVRALVPLQIVPMASRLVIMLILVALGVFTATTAAITVVACGWFSNLLGWRALGVSPRGGGRVRPMLAYGIKTVPASLASMANTRLDQLLVAPILSTAALGIYAVAIGVNVLPIAVAVAVAQAGYHKVTGTPDRSEGGDRLLRKATVIIGATSLASAVGIALLLEPIYGEAFHDAVIPALILVPGSAATGLFLVVWSTGNAIGDPALAAKAQVAGLVVTVALLPLILPALEVNGAALVSTLSYGVRLAVGLWLLRRRGVHLRLRRA